MPRWEIVFYPPANKRHSPVDIINSISRMSDIALIRRRIDHIGGLDPKDWPSQWVKMIEGLYQMYAGDYRVYFGLTGKTMVICHICRKVSQKAKRDDLNVASKNYRDYLEGAR